MKRRKFFAMTNWEYFLKHCMTQWRRDIKMCPYSFGLENYYKVCGPMPCYLVNDCDKCWDLFAKRNGKYILKEVKK